MELSFSEKRSLQKTVQTNLAGLAAGNVPFSEKRRMQKEVADALVKLGTKAVPQQSKDEWEADIVYAIEEKIGVTTSDAQGIMMAQEFIIAQAWGQGLDADATADKIIVASEVKKPTTIADVNEIMPLIKNFIGSSQLSAMGAGIRGEEGQHFKDKFMEVAKVVQGMPSSYETDGQGDSAVAYLHYFKGGSDWYITEKDKGDVDDPIQGVQEQAFGYAILNGDKQNAESGYISIKELIDLGVELDLYWAPKSLAEIKGKSDKPDNQDSGNQGADLDKMIHAIESYGGTVGDKTAETIAFFSAGKTALLAYQAGAYRVRFGDNGTDVTDAYVNPDDAVGEFIDRTKGAAVENQKLADLLSGKYNTEAPEVFLKVLKDVIGEIDDVAPVIPAAVKYIEANQNLIAEAAETAFAEVFGKRFEQFRIFEAAKLAA